MNIKRVFLFCLVLLLFSCGSSEEEQVVTNLTGTQAAGATATNTVIPAGYFNGWDGSGSCQHLGTNLYYQTSIDLLNVQAPNRDGVFYVNLYSDGNCGQPLLKIEYDALLSFVEDLFSFHTFDNTAIKIQINMTQMRVTPMDAQLVSDLNSGNCLYDTALLQSEHEVQRSCFLTSLNLELSEPDVFFEALLALDSSGSELLFNYLLPFTGGVHTNLSITTPTGYFLVDVEPNYVLSIENFLQI